MFCRLSIKKKGLKTGSPPMHKKQNLKRIRATRNLKHECRDAAAPKEQKTVFSQVL